jgi:uncharacterized phage protein (TIGR02218 family)
MSNAFVKELLNQEFTSFHYCVSFKLLSGKIYYFTDAASNKVLENRIYLAEAGLKILEIESNEGGQDYIELEMLEGYFSDAQELLDAEVKLLFYLPEKQVYFHYYTMYVTSINNDRCKLYLKLEPITTKLQKTLLYTYSRTCRAEFGGDKCRVDKSLYTTTAKVESINGHIITLAECDKENGYYDAGEIIFENDLIVRILTQNGKIIKCDKPIPERLEDTKTLKIMAGCDKKFTTCCNKFNNAINFRGEPNIPGNKIIKT